MSDLFSRLVALILCCGVSAAVVPGAVRAAEEPRAWLHVNGYSLHFHAPDANPYLAGLGLSLPAKPWGPFRASWVGDAFQDSGRKFSAYAGQAVTLPLGRGFDAGLTGALMYHRNFARHNRLSVLPVVLPFADYRLGTWKLRTYYVPPVRSVSDHQVAAQLMIPLDR